MIATRFLSRQAEALEHILAGYHTESDLPYSAREQTALDHFTIALSREVGTPAQEVAREIGKRLDWPVYERELPARIAQELHVPVAAVEDIDERQPSWLLECIESFGSQCALSESRYFRRLISLIHSLGEQGRCLIVGHGAAFLLPPHSTLRVCLVGDRENRIDALCRSLHVDHGTAARQLDKVQREHSRFIRSHFHIDPSQPRNYDLVLNCSRWSPTECADFILRGLHQKANGPTSR